MNHRRWSARRHGEGGTMLGVLFGIAIRVIAWFVLGLVIAALTRRQSRGEPPPANPPPQSVGAAAAVAPAVDPDTVAVAKRVLTGRLGLRPIEADRAIQAALAREPGITAAEELVIAVYRNPRT